MGSQKSYSNSPPRALLRPALGAQQSARQLRRKARMMNSQRSVLLLTLELAAQDHRGHDGITDPAGDEDMAWATYSGFITPFPSPLKKGTWSRRAVPLPSAGGGAATGNR